VPPQHMATTPAARRLQWRARAWPLSQSKTSSRSAWPGESLVAAAAARRVRLPASPPATSSAGRGT
jgi:hypothetical protein